MVTSPQAPAKEGRLASFTYVDLLDWSQALALWQRDALRRVLNVGKLDENEIIRLLNLAKASHGVGDITAEPIPASEGDVQPQPTGAVAVRLVGVRDIAQVNALGGGPVLFSTDGLTIIYGGNGTGKSGIARILKKACLSRNPGGSIRPNVFRPEPDQPAHATIDFLEGNRPQSLNWVDGGPSSSALRLVNIFDSASATVQVSERNLISYTPALLQVLRSLAEAIDKVAAAIRHEKTALGECPIAIQEMRLAPSTAAGRFLGSLGPESKTELERLCKIAEKERERSRALDLALTDNASRAIQKLELQERKVSETQVLAASAADLLSNNASEEFAKLVEKRRIAERAAETAWKVFTDSSAFRGVGTEVWRVFWESARRYSESHAYVGEPFPVVRRGARCVLCQQVLDSDSSARLHSFEEFVKSDVQMQADDANTQVEGKKSAIVWLRLPRSVRAQLIETGLIGTPEGNALRRFLICAKLRRRYLIRVSNHQRVGGRPELQEATSLLLIQNRIKDQIAELRGASQSETRAAMEREREELRAREKLEGHKQTVQQEIERLRSLQRLDTVLADCKTQPITLKAREAANTIITHRLRSAFATNLAQIGFSETPVEVMLGPGDHGQHPFERKLIPKPDVPPEDVLSEGEQRCVALAGFLAELETTENSSAIVLDDPVSSLDHRYRKRVAERLVRDAKSRQVIIFTHDIVFLFLVRKYSRELSVALTEVSVEKGYKGDHGRASEGPPWIAMTVKQRLGKLRNDLVEAKRVLRDVDRKSYELRALEIYRRLRQSWERAVEEVLLYETVLRFGDAIQTQRLPKLTDISDSDVETVTKEMSRCSDFVHDEAGAVYAETPDPDVVDDDISRLNDWVKAIRDRRK
jgi:AAA domain-containing protein